MTHTNSYAIGLDRNPANYTPLTPIGFLERAARVYPDRIAMIHGDWQMATGKPPGRKLTPVVADWPRL